MSGERREIFQDGVPPSQITVIKNYRDESVGGYARNKNVSLGNDRFFARERERDNYVLVLIARYP